MSYIENASKRKKYASLSDWDVHISFLYEIFIYSVYMRCSYILCIWDVYISLRLRCSYILCIWDVYISLRLRCSYILCIWNAHISCVYEPYASLWDWDVHFSSSLAVLRVFYRWEKNVFHHLWFFLFSVSDWIFERSWPRLFRDFSAFQILSSIVICY
jgi:hypothetical protein